jgi:hypothetical protein
MSSTSVQARSHLWSRWKVWGPPVLLTLLVFGALLLFAPGSKVTLFTYKLF